jgi:uncharacterized membrane protein YqgA involved in biofilm formation
MMGIGTLANVLAIVAGSLTGLCIKRGIPQKFSDTVMQALGLSVFVIGISGVLKGIYTVTEYGKLEREHIMLMILSLVGGAILGEALDLESKLGKLAQWFQNKFGNKDSNFVQGFVSTTLLYCVGAMAIVGSLEDGLFGNPATLYAKSVLDGISAVVFSATLGIGVMFSSVPVALYQGSITFLAILIRPWLTDMVINQTSLVGSVLIMAIGINLLKVTTIKVANMLPSIFVPIIYYVILSFLHKS